jgi:iron(III) transport system ATP-binding protein
VSEVAIRCVAVGKAYGAVQAVRDLDLTVRRGTLLALVGPSGCGKTTTLRLIAGLEHPTRGVIEVGGQVVAGCGYVVPPERRRVGLVFQDYALFPHLTVGENVGYGLAGPRRQRARRVAEMLRLVGLAGFEGRMAHELSGGEQQRVALARALAPEPVVLLLDEPFSNLDAELRRALREEVREILHRSGTTAVFVTHDQEEALVMGDEVAVMRAGRIEQVDRPEDLFHFPRTRFVAAFLGRPDFLPGRVTPAGVETEVGLVPLHPPLPAGTAVEVLVRADDCDLRPGGAAAVMARYFQGPQHLYQVRLPSGRTVHSLQKHTVHYAPGEAVTVVVDPGHPLVCFPLEGPRAGEGVLAVGEAAGQERLGVR